MILDRAIKKKESKTYHISAAVVIGSYCNISGAKEKKQNKKKKD